MPRDEQGRVRGNGAAVESDAGGAALDFWPGTIRLATAADGPAIGRLFAACEWNDYGVEWTRVDPSRWWLVAERDGQDGQLVGALQLMAGIPFAYIGHFLVHPRERGRDPEGAGSLRFAPGSLAFTLLAWAHGLCERSGAHLILGFTHDAAWLALLRQLGAADLGAVRLTARATSVLRPGPTKEDQPA